MELLFIGVACTDEAIKESNRKYYNNMSQVRPQQYFDLSLTSGLSSQCNVTAISLPPVAAFPNSKCLFYQRTQDIVSKTLKIKYITLLNLPGIKTIMTMFYVFIATLWFCIKNRKKDASILMGYILFYTAIPAMLIAKTFGIKIIVLVPDVPEHVISYTKRSGQIRFMLTKLSLVLNKLVENRFDGYVLLTEQMIELVNLKKKPYIVIEGMIETEDIHHESIEKEKSTRVIMHAGTLHVKFGIKKLVESFKLCESDNCELWIFGVGDYLENLQKDIVGNKKIKYKGSVGRSEIIEFERKASLLVNPRSSNEEFTKYSFPSKIIEYMASGTPVLTTKLPGMPEEYYDYVYLFEDESVEGMAKTIDRILKLPKEELHAKGAAAKEFVLREKNNIVQAKRIVEMIRGVLVESYD